MILAGFFQTVEFFVIAALVAAAAVAYMCMPRPRGEAVLHTIGGELLEGDDSVPGNTDDCGEIQIEVRDDGAVVLTRTGIGGITTSGAVSLAATVTGFDMHIEERRTRGFSDDPLASSARFVLDFLAPDWYHVRYSYGDGSEFCSFQLHVRPGIKMRRRIRR
ncbi:MAG: hypothetical protein K2L80_04875 [Muribaculaceae bacterium]|nr:hypothetical protein [Muribaculaceae bacterium]